jgi:hypothetical protein
MMKKLRHQAFETLQVTGMTLSDQNKVHLLYPPGTFLHWNSTDILPEGLVRELPDADSYAGPAAPVSSSAIDDDDDLEELQRQLDALNAS